MFAARLKTTHVIIPLLCVSFLAISCQSDLITPPNNSLIVNGEAWCSPQAGTPEEQAEAGLGGLTLGEDEFGSTCKWVCGAATLLFGFDKDINEWVAIGGGADPSIEGGFTPAEKPGELPTCNLWELSD